MNGRFGQVAAALLCGALFGAGLAVGGMTDPGRILAFLDVLGAWDPTLLFVMGGALAVTLPGYAWAMRGRPVLEASFDLPATRAIDARLVGGASLFGIGWGLVGYCPGPAVASLWQPTTELAVFILMMLAGMGLQAALPRGVEDDAGHAPASGRN